MAVVSLSLLSSGISSAAFAAAEPISVTTNKEWYADGATIIISGFVKNFDASDPMKSSDVSILILAPNGNIATVAQVTPDTDGNYSTASLPLPIVAGGPLIMLKAIILLKYSGKQNQPQTKPPLSLEVVLLRQQNQKNKNQQ